MVLPATYVAPLLNLEGNSHFDKSRIVRASGYNPVSPGALLAHDTQVLFAIIAKVAARPTGIAELIKRRSLRSN